MNNIKTTLAVIGLLLIGFIGGFITHRQLVKKEMRRVVRLGEAPLFRQHLIERLDPDSAQLSQIESVLEEHVLEMQQLMLSNRQARADLIRELEKELQPILTKEQLEQLHDFNQRFKRPPPPARRAPLNHRRPKGGR